MVTTQASRGDLNQRRATRPLTQLLLGVLLFELVGWLALWLEFDRQLGISGPFWLAVATVAAACLVLLLSIRALVVRRGWFTLKEFMVCVLVIGAICGWVGDVYQEKREQRRIAEFLSASGVLVEWGGDDAPSLERLIGPGYFHGVKGLSVTTSCPLTAEEMAAVAGLEELERASLFSASVRDGHLKSLSAVATLRDVALSGDDRCTGAGLVHFRDHPSLERLFLQGRSFDEQELIHLQHIPKLKRLTIGFPITDAGMAHLGRCKSLETLLLYDAGGAGLEHLADLPRLTGLVIYSKTTSDADLAALADMNNLTSLNLDARITDAGLEHISKIRNLEHLSLTSSLITARGIDFIESMERLKSVQFPQTETTVMQRVVELRARRPELNVAN